MSPWWILIIGLIAGLTLQWLLDYLFWRQRRVTSKLESQLQDALHKAQSDRTRAKAGVHKVAQHHKRLKKRTAKIAAYEEKLKLRSQKLSNIDTLMGKLGFSADQGTAEALSNLNQTTSALKATAKQRSRVIDALQNQLESQESSATDQQSTISQLKSQLTASEKNNQSATQQNDEDLQNLSQKLRDRDVQIGELDTRLNAQSSKTQSLLENIDQTKLHYEAREKDQLETSTHDADRLGAEIQERDEHIHQLRNEAAVLETALAELGIDASDDLGLAIETAQQNTDTLAQSLAKSDQALAQRNDDVATLTQRSKSRETQIQELTSELVLLQGRITESDTALAEALQKSNHSASNVDKQITQKDTEIAKLNSLNEAIQSELDTNKHNHELVEQAFSFKESDLDTTSKKLREQIQVLEDDIILRDFDLEAKTTELTEHSKAYEETLSDLEQKLNQHAEQNKSLQLSQDNNTSALLEQLESERTNVRNQEAELHALNDSLNAKDLELAQQTAALDESITSALQLANESTRLEADDSNKQSKIAKLSSDLSSMTDIIAHLGFDTKGDLAKQVELHSSGAAKASFDHQSTIGELQRKLSSKDAQSEKLENQIQFLQTSIEERDEELTEKLRSISSSKVRQRALDDELNDLTERRETDQQLHIEELTQLNALLEEERSRGIDWQSKLLTIESQIQMRDYELEQNKSSLDKSDVEIRTRGDDLQKLEKQLKAQDLAHLESTENHQKEIAALSKNIEQRDEQLSLSHQESARSSELKASTDSELDALKTQITLSETKQQDLSNENAMLSTQLEEHQQQQKLDTETQQLEKSELLAALKDKEQQLALKATISANTDSELQTLQSQLAHEETSQQALINELNDLKTQYKESQHQNETETEEQQLKSVELQAALREKEVQLELKATINTRAENELQTLKSQLTHGETSQQELSSEITDLKIQFEESQQRQKENTEAQLLEKTELQTALREKGEELALKANEVETVKADNQTRDNNLRELNGLLLKRESAQSQQSEEIAGLIKQLDLTGSESSARQAELTDLQTALEDKTQQLAETAEALVNKTEEAKTTIALLQSQDSEVRELGTSLEEKNEANQRHEESLSALNTQLQQQSDDITQLNTQLDLSETSATEQQSKLAHLQSDLEEKDQQLELQAKTLAEKTEEASEVNTRLQSRDENVKDLNTSLEQRDNTNKQQATALDELQAEIQRQSEQLTQLNAQLELSENTSTQQLTKVSNLQESLEEKEQQLTFQSETLIQKSEEAETATILAQTQGSQVQALNTSLEQRESTNKLQEEVADSLKIQLQQQTDLTQEKQTQLSDFQQTLNQKEEQLLQFATDIEESKSELQTQNENLSQLKTQLADSDSSKEAQDKVVVTLQAQLTEQTALATEAQSRWDSHRQEHQSRTDELSQKSYELSEAQALQEENEATLQTLNTAVAQYKSDHSQQTEIVKSLQDQIDQQAPNANKIREQLASTQDTLKFRDSELAQRATEIKEAGQQLQSKSTELSSLKTQLDKQEKKLAQSQEELSQINDSIGDKALGESMADATTRLHQQIKQLENKLDDRDEQLTGAEGNIAVRDSELLRLRSQLKLMRANLNDRDQELDEKAVWVSNFRQRMKQRQNEVVTPLAGELSQASKPVSKIHTSAGPDKLTRIWGIDFKMAQFMRKKGIRNYAQLVELKPEEQGAILAFDAQNQTEDKGALTEADLDWWAKQAELAVEGRWAEIETLRKEKAIHDNERQLIKIVGIDKKLQALLKTRGIGSYRKLADSLITQIEDLLQLVEHDYPGWSTEQIHQSWIRQSVMADQQKWGELKDYQLEFCQPRQLDNLQLIKGVSARLERLLRSKGISTYLDLSKASVTQLTDILNSEGPGAAKFYTPKILNGWIEQAHQSCLAAESDESQPTDNLGAPNPNDEAQHG